MTTKETRPLAALAAKAHKHQESLGLTDGQSFDEWRHAQVMAVTGKPGLTKCHHHDFKPLQAHFQTLLGDDAAAFDSHMRTGKPTDSAAPGDTHEARRQMAHKITEAVETHCYLADHTLDEILADARADAEAAGVPFQPSHDSINRIRSSKAEISEKGVIRAGYVVTLVRRKFRRPGFSIRTADGINLKTELAERLTVTQLEQLLSTVINRIAAHEGRGSTQSRNKGQRKPRR